MRLLRVLTLFRTRTKQALVASGLLLCIAAVPAGVAANGTAVVAPSGAARSFNPSSNAPLPVKGSQSTGSSNAQQILDPYAASSNAGNTDTCGYPDASNAPRSQTVFNENDVTQGIMVFGSGTTAKIVAFATDETGLFYSATNTFTDQHGTSLGTADGNGRPFNPTLYVTDLGLSTNPSTSRSGDWQQSANPTGFAANVVYGAFTSQLHGPVPQIQNWAGLPFTAPTGLKSQNHDAEIVWNASSLGLVAGHTYRFQAITHDADENKGTTNSLPSGDVGEVCTNLASPTPPVANCFPTKTVSTGDGNAVASGTLLTYTITLTGNGGTAGDCQANDVLSLINSASLTNISIGTPSQGSLSNAAGKLYSWDIPSLVPGAANAATLVVTGNAIGTVAGSEIDNNVTVIPQDCLAPNTCTVTVHTPINPPPAGPECTPSKTGTPSGSVPIGTVITYTVSIKNNGGSSGNCVVQDVLTGTSDSTVALIQGPQLVSPAVLPTTSAFQIINGPCTPTACSNLPYTIGWTVNNLAPNQSLSFTMKVKVTGAGTIIDQANGTGSLTGLITNTATSTVLCTANCIIIVNNPVTFQLTKTVTPKGTVPNGTTLTYTVTLKNTSQNDSQVDVLVDDALSGTASVVVNDGSGGTTNSFVGPTGVVINTVGADHYQWTIPAADLKAGESASVTFTAVINGGPGNSSSCLLSSVSSTNDCLDNTATALNIPITVENLTPKPPHSSVQGITTTPSSGAFDDMNLTVAGSLFLGGIGLVLFGLLARSPAPGRRQAKA